VVEHQSRSTREWEEARRKAFLHDALGILARRPVDLLPFEEVRQGLRLRNSRSLGILSVPLDQIVGSTDRYTDFTREFLPRYGFLERRWERVDALVHGHADLGPVELYQVGDVFFVRDGNHRVSVARQHGDPSIQARVWQFDVRVPIGTDTNLGDILCEAARSAFLEETNADRLCPHVDINLTRPDGYDYLLYEINGFQQAVSRIDDREVAMDEAVPLWCDMAYLPLADMIREKEVLRHFPDCTETDLYLWMRRNQEELEIRYGRDILMAEATDDLVARSGQKASGARRLQQGAGRLAKGMGELSGRLSGRTIPHARRDRELGRVSRAQLLASVCEQTNSTPALRFEGNGPVDWARWRAALGDRLRDVLGLGDRPWNQADRAATGADVEEIVLIGNVRRELAWIGTEDGLRIPVYVHSPQDTDGPRPAIAIFAGHATIAQTAGIDSAHDQPDALAIAQAGFVTLTMEMQGFGLLGSVDHLHIDRAARVAGRTWLGLVVWDALKAVDYLIGRSDVDAGQIGAAGVGVGGGLAVYLAALDDRLSAVMASRLLTKYGLVCLGDEYCRCRDLPGILPEAEMGDIAALVAPRPALYNNGASDPATPPAAARESFAVAQRVYRALGAPNRIRLVESPDSGDTFDHELAVAWFGRCLRR